MIFFLAFVLFLFFVFLFNNPISSSICKLPIRSEIYNCTFKNTNKLSIISISETCSRSSNKNWDGGEAGKWGGVGCQRGLKPSLHDRPSDRAEQRLRMCRDRRGLGSKLVSFSKGFLKHLHILAIIKVDSEYLRFSFKLKVDYFILYWILVSTLVIFLLLFSMNKRRRTNEASLQ